MPTYVEVQFRDGDKDQFGEHPMGVLAVYW